MKNLPLTDIQKARILEILGDDKQKPLAVAAIRQHPPLLGYPPPRLRGERHDRMTILVGITGKQSIILGADSQWTDSIDGSTTYGDKIGVVRFCNDHVLVAQAGLRPVSTKVVRLMQKKAINVKITEPDDVTQVLEDSVRELRSKINKKQWDYVEKYGAAFMLAFYTNNRPQLYTCLASATGIAEPAASHYATAGCAEGLANYLLREFSAPDAEDDMQFAALVYTIAKAKQNNGFCGGPITVKVLQSFPTGSDSPRVGKSRQIDPGFAQRFEAALNARDEQARAARNEQIIAVLRQISQELSSHERIDAEAAGLR
jgi:20S proteasome alpha/beta subunit